MNQIRSWIGNSTCFCCRHTQSYTILRSNSTKVCKISTHPKSRSSSRTTVQCFSLSTALAWGQPCTAQQCENSVVHSTTVRNLLANSSPGSSTAEHQGQGLSLVATVLFCERLVMGDPWRKEYRWFHSYKVCNSKLFPFLNPNPIRLTRGSTLSTQHYDDHIGDPIRMVPYFIHSVVSRVRIPCALSE